jgi:hypothetical protein
VCHYSVHLRKGRVVFSQCPLVRWALGHWHYERTLHSRWPLEKGWSFYLSIYLETTGVHLQCPLTLHLLNIFEPVKDTLEFRIILKPHAPSPFENKRIAIFHTRDLATAQI